MRHTTVVGLGAAAALGAAAVPAGATFHLMQIEQVIGGVGGDTSAQAIQLRMRAPNQCFLSSGRLRVSDAAGLNPIVIQTFSTCPPFPNPCVAGCGTAKRVLIASASFSSYLDSPIAIDFTMENLIPASYLAAGSLTFEADSGLVYWRLSWGGAAYTGPNNVALDNDADGSAAPPFPEALPSETDQAILFDGLATDPSTNNAADYIVTPGPAVFTNNAAASATVTLPETCPWDCEAAPNGVVGTTDLLALLAQWGTVDAPCNFDTGVVGTTDLLKLLANWGACP